MPSEVKASSSSIAARSAENSLKRARILYDVNPQAAFLPTVDPTILQASINRRKRRLQPQQRQQRQDASSNALALITDDMGMKPLPSSGKKETTTAWFVQAIPTRAQTNHQESW